MADTQNEIYGQAYSQNIMQLAQQKYAKLLNTVFIKPNVRGKTFFQDQIGEWEMETKGGRNVDTPNNDPNLGRRMGIMVDYHDNRMLDRGDELKTISDPKSSYTIAAAQSLGRKIDDVIIGAIRGAAYSGETGSTTAPTASIIAVSAASMSLAFILAAKKELDDNDVEMEDRYMVVNTEALNSMLDVTEVGSSDYNSIKALVRGELETYLGFNWIMSTRVNASDVGYAYQKYGICMAMADAPMVRTDERKDKSYSWQIYYELNVGAVRLEESRVKILQEG